MTLSLYDLVGADARLRFSPVNGRARTGLLHTGLEFDVVPWRCSARETIAASGHPSGPVIRGFMRFARA